MISDVIFDDAGHAVNAGYVKVYHFKNGGEYCGWSDEYISVGLGLPGNSTLIAAGEPVNGQVWVFDGNQWFASEDHRGETVYSTTDGCAVVIDYIGPVAEGYVTKPPASEFDKWNGSEWVIDTDAQHAADVAAAEQTKQNLLAAARSTISIWQTELQLGSISEQDKSQLIAWLAYIKEVQAVDTSGAPDINWPAPPAA